MRDNQLQNNAEAVGRAHGRLTTCWGAQVCLTLRPAPGRSADRVPAVVCVIVQLEWRCIVDRRADDNGER